MAFFSRGSLCSLRNPQSELLRLEKSRATYLAPQVDRANPMTIPSRRLASSEALSVTYRSTRAAHWRCNLYAMSRNKLSVFITGACILMIGATWPLPALTTNAATNAALRVLIAASVMGLLNLAVLTVGMFTRLPTAKTVRMCMSGLTPDGVRDVTPEKQRVLSWNKITRICESKGDVHVWSGVNGIFIPREAFNNPEEARRFTELAVDLWRSKGTSWPEVAGSSWKSVDDLPSIVSVVEAE